MRPVLQNTRRASVSWPPRTHALPRSAQPSPPHPVGRAPGPPPLPKGGRAALAGNRTRVNCLEGSYAHHYTTNASRPGRPGHAPPGLPAARRRPPPAAPGPRRGASPAPPRCHAKAARRPACQAQHACPIHARALAHPHARQPLLRLRTRPPPPSGSRSPSSAAPASGSSVAPAARAPAPALSWLVRALVHQGSGQATDRTRRLAPRLVRAPSPSAPSLPWASENSSRAPHPVRPVRPVRPTRVRVRGPQAPRSLVLRVRGPACGAWPKRAACLPVGESNPGLPRDRRGYSPLY